MQILTIFDKVYEFNSQFDEEKGYADCYFTLPFYSNDKF